MAHDPIGGSDFKVLSDFTNRRAVASIDNLVAKKLIDFALPPSERDLLSCTRHSRLFRVG